MFDPDAEALREALRRHLEERRLSVNAWARQAGIREGTLRNFLSGRSETVRYTTLVALARASGLQAGDFLRRDRHIRSNEVTVQYETNAKEWRNSGLGLSLTANFPVDPRYPDAERFAVLVGDSSFDLVFKQDSILVCAAYKDVKRKPAVGDRVLCLEERASEESKRDDESYPDRERRSVREIVEAEDRRWLVLRSASPRWHDPIQMPRKFMPVDPNPAFVLEDRVVSLEGVVIASYRLE